MKPAPFELHRPRTLEEAVEVLSAFQDDAKVLAGGQSLVPLLALRLARFDHLVDLNGIASLRSVRRDGHMLRVGAMTRQAEAERDEDVPAVPLLLRALPFIGHFQIRNRGTIGGSTAHADPASELPAVALALDAELVVTSSAGTRTLAARDFFQGTWTTALGADEILTEIGYPLWAGRTGFAVEEFARRHGDFAIAGVACGVALDGEDRIVRAAVALFGMGPTPIRADMAEAALVGQRVSELDRAAVAAIAVEGTEPAPDIHGPASFRRRVAAHLVAEALQQATAEATAPNG